MKKIISKFSLLLTCLLLLSCGGSTDSSRQVDSSGQQLNVPPPVSLNTNTATFNGIRANFNISKSDLGYAIANNLDGSVIDVPISIKSMVFDDLSVNLEMNAVAKSVSPADLKLLIELYVAFFNRVPEADGLSYWITEKKNGQSIAQISESFYNAAILYSNLSGYSASMTNSDFVRVIYKNVLGRSGSSAPPDEDVNYWAGELSSGRASKGSLIIAMLNSAHSFLNNPTWGWVAQLLDNKYDVAYQFAIVRGLNFKTPEESIKRTMDIARAITPNDVVVSKRLFEILLAEGTDDFTGDKAELIVSQFGSGSITDDAGLLNCQEQICKAVYKKKSEVKLKAVPATGWKLDRWEGCESESEMTCRVLIQNGKTVHPYFSRTTQPQINADVVVLTDQTINELLSNKDNTLTFSPQATQLLSLSPNNIIVSGKGEGFARRIVSISALSNGDIEVKTKLVGLAEIISEGTFISKQSPTPSQISVVELAKGVKLSPAPSEGAGSTLDLDIKLDDKVSISGKLRVTFNPEWALDFGMFYGLKELKIMLNPTISPDISVVWNGVEIDKKNATKDFSLGIFKLAPIYIQAGPVPIVIVPTFKGYVYFEGKANAKVSFVSGYSIQGSYGVHYHKNAGWNGLSSTNLNGSFKPVGSLALEAKFGLGVTSTFSIYDTLGPFIKVGPYLKMSGDFSPTSTSLSICKRFKVNIGASAEAGGEFKLLNFYDTKFEVNILDKVFMDLMNWESPICSDLDPPSQPGSLTAIPSNLSGSINSKEIQLKWSASTDNNNVRHYDVFRDGVFVGRSETPIFLDKNLLANTGYCYKVYAVDFADNKSIPSENICAKTLGMLETLATDIVVSTGNSWAYGDSALMEKGGGGLRWVEDSLLRMSSAITMDVFKLRKISAHISRKTGLTSNFTIPTGKVIFTFGAQFCEAMLTPASSLRPTVPNTSIAVATCEVPRTLLPSANIPISIQYGGDAKYSSVNWTGNLDYRAYGGDAMTITGISKQVDGSYIIRGGVLAAVSPLTAPMSGAIHIVENICWTSGSGPGEREVYSANIVNGLFELVWRPKLALSREVIRSDFILTTASESNSNYYGGFSRTGGQICNRAFF